MVVIVAAAVIVLAVIVLAVVVLVLAAVTAYLGLTKQPLYNIQIVELLMACQPPVSLLGHRLRLLRGSNNGSTK